MGLHLSLKGLRDGVPFFIVIFITINERSLLRFVKITIFANLQII
jgi:hypothetical protein